MKENKTYITLKNINNSLLTAAGEMLEYSWTDAFKVQNMQDIKTRFLNHIVEQKITINLDELSSEQLLDLGFKHWAGTNTFLIPIWLKSFLNQEYEVTDIFGRKVKIKGLDTDNRFGMLAAYITK